MFSTIRILSAAYVILLLSAYSLFTFKFQQLSPTARPARGTYSFNAPMCAELNQNNGYSYYCYYYYYLHYCHQNNRSKKYLNIKNDHIRDPSTWTDFTFPMSTQSLFLGVLCPFSLTSRNTPVGHSKSGMFSFLREDKHQQICQIHGARQSEECKRNSIIVSESYSQVGEKI